MSEPHIIKLNGPWQVSLRDRQGLLLFEQRANIRISESWQELAKVVASELQSSRVDPTEDCDQNETCLLELARRFKWPSVNDAHQPIVQLVIEGCRGLEKVTLNENEIWNRSAESAHDFSDSGASESVHKSALPSVLKIQVSDQLLAGNQLLLQFRPLDIEKATRWLSIVFLQID